MQGKEISEAKDMSILDDSTNMRVITEALEYVDPNAVREQNEENSRNGEHFESRKHGCCLVDGVLLRRNSCVTKPTLHATTNLKTPSSCPVSCP